ARKWRLLHHERHRRDAMTAEQRAELVDRDGEGDAVDAGQPALEQDPREPVLARRAAAEQIRHGTNMPCSGPQSAVLLLPLAPGEPFHGVAMAIKLHEVHPALVHLPLTLFPIAIGADLVGRVTGNDALMTVGR